MTSLTGLLEGRRALWSGLAAGLASSFAFAPMGLWPLMPLALAILCALLWRAENLKRALLIGWLFGFGQFLIGLNWIATAFTYQDNMPAWLGWVGVLLLSLYLAIFPALASGLGWRFGKGKPVVLVLALAGGWAVSEWLRASLFTGFAWNPIGVSLVGTGLAGPASLIGTYGLSALVALLSGAIWLFERGRWREALIGIATIMAGCVLLRPSAPAVEGSPTIAVVQPNIGQADKWKPGAETDTAMTMERLSRDAGDVKLLFWPEAAVIRPLEDQRDLGERLAAFERLRAAQSIGPDGLLVTGGLGVTSIDGMSPTGATNSVYLLDPGGNIRGRYDKAHLVPYGEYLPMRSILEPIGLSRLAPGGLDFSAGPGARTMDLPGGSGRMGLQICYEIIFSGQVVDRANRPDFIFNPSNDAWFGSWGPPQHLAQARLRAIEEGLPVIRATPTGISAVIDAAGEIDARLAMGEEGVIRTNLPLARAPTLFSRGGNILSLAFGFLLIAIAIVLSRRSS